MNRHNPSLALIALVTLFTAEGSARSIHIPSVVKLLGARYVGVSRHGGRPLTPANVETATRLFPISDADYPKSGLYSLNDRRNPIWALDSFGWDGNQLLSDDGDYFVQTFGAFGQGAEIESPEARHEVLKRAGLTIYFRGRWVLFWPASNLVTAPNRLEFQPSGNGDYADLPWLKAAAIDSSKQTLDVDTLDGTHTVIELQTGRILSQTGPKPAPPIGWIGPILFAAFALATTIAFLLFFRMRGRRRQRVTSPSPSR